MKLNPGKRSILAGFVDERAAQAAKQELQSAGFNTVQIDRVSEQPDPTDIDSRRPALGGAGSNAAAVLFDGEGSLSEDRRPLLAAMPEVSGMAGEAQREAPFLLTAVVSAERLDEALQIIRARGGDA